MKPPDQTEVLVIGAGLFGAVATLRLAEAGVRVTCLEQGSWQAPEDHPGDKPTFELDAEGKWDANPNMRVRPCDYRRRYLVCGAYYLHPTVKAALGYHGQEALTLPRGGFGAEVD